MAGDDRRRQPRGTRPAGRGRANQPAGVDGRHEDQEIEPAEGSADFQAKAGQQPGQQSPASERPAVASQTKGIESQAKRNKPSVPAARAAISVNAGGRGRGQSWARAANTMATASTLTAGSDDAVSSRPKTALPTRIAQVPKRLLLSRPAGDHCHGQRQPGQGVLQGMTQQAGRTGRQPGGDHAGDQHDNRRGRDDIVGAPHGLF